ncbi:hypothetical protein [Ramlibacter sp.]|uniref:hypothetical protein n=1 Tax=Ramlibacter sp. TaxID=1917967 RepID=UPI002ED4E3FE
MALASSMLFAASASAAVFAPLPPDSALTLGSGVDIAQPQQAVPSCFDFKVVQRDVPTTQRYDIYVKAVNTVEEVHRERRRRGSVGGSWGAVSASLSAWSNEQNTDRRAGLFVILEARYIGPRSIAEEITPSPAVAALLAQGKAADIVRRCGTHVAATEHRGQTLRLVLNLSDIEHSAKQEIAVRFGAKAKFGLGGGKASGSYTSTVATLARENRLSFAMEGSGTAPALQRVTDLFKTKAGDLAGVADALAALLATTSPGSPTSFVTYGFTLQPISLFTSQVPASGEGEEEVQQLEQLQDLNAMLGAQANETRRQLDTSGLSPDSVERLRREVQQYRTIQAGIRNDIASCRWEAEGSDKSCEAALWKWRGTVTASRGIEARFVGQRDRELGIETRLPYPAAGTLLAGINGRDVPLDAFKIFPGVARTSVLRLAGNASDPQLFSEAPLTLNLMMLLASLPDRPERDMVRSIQVGCLGAAAFAPPAPGIYTLFVEPVLSVHAVKAPTVSPDSVCAGPAIGFVGSPMVGPRPLMPPGLTALELQKPQGAVPLKLQLVDSYGLVTEHLIVPDLAAILREGR